MAGTAREDCAGEKENVLIAGPCSVSVLPRLGGKIASIRILGQELLQQPLLPLAPRPHHLPFEQSDASGWDECLPTIEACTVKGVRIPDHGDLWQVPWQVLDSSDSAIRMRGECFSLPLALERNLELSETDGGWRIGLSYTLTNTGTVATPWRWSAHPLFTALPGDSIQLPGAITELTLASSNLDRLGSAGGTVQWPIATLANGTRADLRQAQPESAAIGDMLFSGRLTADQAWFQLERPSAGMRIRVGFDAAKTPYLGLWICYGGWPQRPGPKQVAIAPEPATSPTGSVAGSGDWSTELAPGDSFSWPMVVDFESIQVV